MFSRRRHSTDPPSAPAPVLVSVDVGLAMRFVGEAGRQMLEASSSVSEVLDQLRNFLPFVGLQGCAVDANLSTLTLSYWPPGQDLPVTTTLEVRAAQPHLERLSGTVSLLQRVERGEIELIPAFEQLRTLAELPLRRRSYARAAILVSVAGWVLFLNGVNVTSVLVALLATALTFPVSSLISRLRLPMIAGTFVAAIILAAVPNLLRATLAFDLVAAIVAGLFIYLPGRAFVTAVVDGLANAPVSAITRAFEALLTAGALALGVLVGGQIGAGLGVELSPDFTSAPLWISVLGAAVGVLGISVAWGMPWIRVLPTVLIAAVSWTIVSVATRGDSGSGWTAYLVAAGLVGLTGVIVASLQGGTASVYTGVAILPLVPGFTLYQGMLALVLTEGGATGPLKDAAEISLAIAGGVAVGFALGRNLVWAGTWLNTRTQLRSLGRAPTRPGRADPPGR